MKEPFKGLYKTLLSLMYAMSGFLYHILFVCAYQLLIQGLIRLAQQIPEKGSDTPNHPSLVTISVPHNEMSCEDFFYFNCKKILKYNVYIVS